MGLKDILDSFEGAEPEKVPEVPINYNKPEKVEEELPPDPYAHLIGRGEMPMEGLSAFDAFLDQVEAEKPEGWQPPAVATEHHDWKIVRQAIYSDDHVVWMCGKCCRTISIERTETLGEALDKIKVDMDCTKQLCEDLHNDVDPQNPPDVEDEDV